MLKQNKVTKITKETKKIEGIYGKYGIRRVGNQIQARIRKKINSIPTDFSSKGVTIELAIADLEKQIDIALNKDIAINTDITVEEWCKHWLETKKDMPSFEYYEQHTRCYILPIIGKMKLTEVKLENLSEIMQKMANGELSEGSRKKGLTKKEHKQTKTSLSQKTMQNVKNTISQIFQEAIDNEKRRPIPLKKIKIPKVEKKSKIHLNKEQKIILLNFLINDENESTKVVSLMLLIQAFRGLRASEVCGIKYKDLDLKNKDMLLNQGCGRKREFDKNLNPTGRYKTVLKSLKSKNSKRKLSFNDLLFDKLRKHMEEDIYNDGLVFHTVTGLPHTAKSVYKKLQQILKQLGLPSVGSHEMRRFFATHLVLNNVNIKVAQELIGHADISTTYRYYVIVEEEEKNKALEEVDNAVLFDIENYNKRARTF